MSQEETFELLHKDITDKILKAFYDVYNRLGYGFLERVYENALAIELRKLGLRVEQQKPLNVYYDGLLVGAYYADLVVEEKVILELKAIGTITQALTAQLQNYLKATEIEVGMLLNFGPKAEFKRKVFSNIRKTIKE